MLEKVPNPYSNYLKCILHIRFTYYKYFLPQKMWLGQVRHIFNNQYALVMHDDGQRSQSRGNRIMRPPKCDKSCALHWRDSNRVIVIKFS